jgi:hypothetical protein
MSDRPRTKTLAEFFRRRPAPGHGGGKSAPARRRPATRLFLALVVAGSIAVSGPAQAAESRAPAPVVQTVQAQQTPAPEAPAEAPQKPAEPHKSPKLEPWQMWLLALTLLSIPYGHYQMGMAITRSQERKEKEEAERKRKEEEARKGRKPPPGNPPADKPADPPKPPPPSAGGANDNPPSADFPDFPDLERFTGMPPKL